MQRIEGLSNFYQGVLRLNIEIEEHQNELHQNSHQWQHWSQNSLGIPWLKIVRRSNLLKSKCTSQIPYPFMDKKVGRKCHCPQSHLVSRLLKCSQMACHFMSKVSGYSSQWGVYISRNVWLTLDLRTYTKKTRILLKIRDAKFWIQVKK